MSSFRRVANRGASASSHAPLTMIAATVSSWLITAWDSLQSTIPHTCSLTRSGSGMGQGKRTGFEAHAPCWVLQADADGIVANRGLVCRGPERPFADDALAQRQDDMEPDRVVGGLAWVVRRAPGRAIRSAVGSVHSVRARPGRAQYRGCTGRWARCWACCGTRGAHARRAGGSTLSVRGRRQGRMTSGEHGTCRPKQGRDMSVRSF